jgi:LmbE family N-acetylglucosaminyl deacetylase
VRLTGIVVATAILALPAPAAAGRGPCTSTMTVVAHEDDDLLFVNPEISGDIAAGRCVTTLYVTSGDAARGPAYWRGREQGEMTAYARMAGRPARWTEDTLTVDGRRVHRATLGGTAITLLFLRLPDRVGGWPDQTLQLLWLDPGTRVRTLDTGRPYTKAGLLRVLTSLFELYQPRIIRTLDFRNAYGDGDHDDHHAVGYLAYAAQRRYRTPHRIIGHRGYPAAGRPANLTAAQYDTKLGQFLAYAAHDPVVCQTADWCTRGNYGVYLRRNIPVAAPVGAGRNVAGQATPTASSARTRTGQVPAKAVDGRLGAALLGEWVTVRQRTGAWLNLRWPSAQRLDRVVLYDRPTRTDRVAAGLLRFSDGSLIRVGPLPDDGTPLTVRFTPKTVTGLRFTITAVSRTTLNAGLAEIRAVTAPDQAGK